MDGWMDGWMDLLSLTPRCRVAAGARPGICCDSLQREANCMCSAQHTKLMTVARRAFERTW